MSVLRKKNILIIGISGVTCGGKTTTATQLNNILPSSHIFSQDDYFLDVKDPRHIWIPELNHINFDVITSLDMKKMHEDILCFIKDKALKHGNHMDKIKFDINGKKCNDTQNYICDKINTSNVFILIIEGFSIFSFEPMLNLFDLKYYFLLKKEECLRRRNMRVYEPPDCPGYFEKCVWPEHIQQLEEVKKVVKNVTYFDEHSGNVVEKILSDILQCL